MWQEGYLSYCMKEFYPNWKGEHRWSIIVKPENIILNGTTSEDSDHCDKEALLDYMIKLLKRLKMAE